MASANPINNGVWIARRRCAFIIVTLDSIVGHDRVRIGSSSWINA